MDLFSIALVLFFIFGGLLSIFTVISENIDGHKAKKLERESKK